MINLRTSWNFFYCLSSWSNLRCKWSFAYFGEWIFSLVRRSHTITSKEKTTRRRLCWFEVQRLLWTEDEMRDGNQVLNTVCHILVKSKAISSNHWWGVFNVFFMNYHQLAIAVIRDQFGSIKSWAHSFICCVFLALTQQNATRNLVDCRIACSLIMKWTFSSFLMSPDCRPPAAATNQNLDTTNSIHHTPVIWSLRFFQYFRHNWQRRDYNLKVSCKIQYVSWRQHKLWQK